MPASRLKTKRNFVNSEEILICLQALVEELKSKNSLYDAYRVSKSMELIRALDEEIRLLHGEVDRRARRRA